VADSSLNTLHTFILIFIFYFELCHSFTHTDSDLTFDRFPYVLYNKPCMQYLIPEAWYKMARTRTTVATDRAEPNSLRVPQKPVSEDQDMDSSLTVASLRWVRNCISPLFFFNPNRMTSWNITVLKKLTVTYIA
jgi:hypothetical protein